MCRRKFPSKKSNKKRKKTKITKFYRNGDDRKNVVQLRGLLEELQKGYVIAFRWTQQIQNNWELIFWTFKIEKYLYCIRSVNIISRIACVLWVQLTFYLIFEFETMFLQSPSSSNKTRKVKNTRSILVLLFWREKIQLWKKRRKEGIEVDDNNILYILKTSSDLKYKMKLLNVCSVKYTFCIMSFALTYAARNEICATTVWP